MAVSNPRIDELRKKFDENPRRYFAPLANEYRKAGDLDQAIEICRAHLREQPSHMSGHVVFGQALYEARQFDEGRTVFEAALQLDPENLIALKHLGDIERELGNPSKARGWYQRVLDADPRNEEIQNQLASLPPDPSEVAASAAPEAQGEAEGTDILGAMDWSDVAPASSTPAQSVAPVSPEATTLVMGRVTVPPEPEPDAPQLLDLRDSSAGMPAIGEQALEAQVAATEGLESTHFEGAEHTPEEQSPLAGLSGNFGAHGASHDTVEEEIPAIELQIPQGDEAATEHRASVDRMMAWNTPTSVTPMSSTPVSSGAVDPLLDDSFAEFTPAAGVPVQPPPETPAVAEPEPEPEPEPESVAEGPTSVDDALWAPGPAAEPEDDAPEQAAEDTPGAFVTETMAELYVRQGLIEHAVGVYRQLVSQSPGDARLRARLDQLEGRPPADVEPDDLSLTREVRMPAAERDASVSATDSVEAAPSAPAAPRGPSMREILARIAATRLGDGAAAWDTQAEVAPGPEAVTPALEHEPHPPPAPSGHQLPDSESEPPSRGVPLSQAPSRAGDALSSLFGGRGVRVEDEAAALALSTLFSNGDAAPPAVGGNPTRVATDEFSLDRVFSDVPRRSTEMRRSKSFSFDQFFSDGSPPPGQGGAAPGASEPREADIAQFNSWLEGLKKK